MDSTGYFVRNPATGKLESTREFDSDERIDQLLAESESAFQSWKTQAPSHRSRALKSLAAALRNDSANLAAILAREVGKPTPQGQYEVELSASIADYYADNYETLLSPDHLSVPGVDRVEVHHIPIGPLLGVMPWNFPFYQFMRFVAPNVLLGNTVVLKPAPQCPESAEAFERLAKSSGLGGVVSIVYPSIPQIERIIESRQIQGVSLTGSERAGRSVAEIAGRNLKKVVLELGGSDPFVVLADADVDAAVAEAVGGRFFNCGQACNSAKRLIVNAAVYDEFLDKLVDAVAALTVGAPDAEMTDIGPVASEQARDNLLSQIADATTLGATVATGGTSAQETPGFWLTPTVLTGVQPGMRAYHEEVFGPVAVLYRANDDDDAVRIANDSEYGLGASVHSQDTDRALALGARLNSGMLFINEATATGAEMPFGGIGRSGFGRELGRNGVREFANERLIRVR